MNNEIVGEVSLHEVLVKTSYQTQITEPDDKNCENPIAFGSGFIVEYENEVFFVTADHTIHIGDYNNSTEERVWKDYVVSIINNCNPSDNFLSTVVTPLGGFYYLEQFNLDKPNDILKPVDIAVCKMKDINFQYPFLTQEVNFSHGETIKAGEPKFKIKKECFSQPLTNKNYFIFGNVRIEIIDNVRLSRENTIKEYLKFISKSGDYYLFNTSDIIANQQDWEGLSGSPVICEDGECIGVLCSVLENSNSIWVMPISKIKMLIEVAIQQEKL